MEGETVSTKQVYRKAVQLAVRCTTFPEVSTDGVHVLSIYCLFINTLHILVEPTVLSH